MNFRDLVYFQLTPSQARLGTAIAAGFNVTGFLLLMLTKYSPGSPLWPVLASMSVGLVILTWLWIGRNTLTNQTVYALYVVNTLSVVTALAFLNDYYATNLPNWVPFRPSQLGCLFTAMIAPSFVLGLFGITAHVGLSLVQYVLFSPEIKARFSEGEPTPILAFGLAALFVLVLRYRNLILQHDFHSARTEAATTKILAINCLFIRDLMNTPLQTLMVSMALIGKGQPNDQEQIDRCNRAIEQLNHLNSLLKRHEPKDSERHGLSFDAASSLKSSN